MLLYAGLLSYVPPGPFRGRFQLDLNDKNMAENGLVYGSTEIGTGLGNLKLVESIQQHEEYR
jgi:hypothetical protein